MTKVSNTLLKINKYKETELLCDHKKLMYEIASLTTLVLKLEEELQKEIEKQMHGPSLDLYEYIEKAKIKIDQCSKERKDLENQKLLLVEKIKENLSEGKKYERLKEIQLEAALSSYKNRANKEENEYSSSKHAFNDQRAAKR
jgi:hypothetical protein